METSASAFSIASVQSSFPLLLTLFLLSPLVSVEEISFEPDSFEFPIRPAGLVGEVEEAPNEVVQATMSRRRRM
jgi:predicted AAA+ superfamily ATPase